MTNNVNTCTVDVKVFFFYSFSCNANRHDSPFLDKYSRESGVEHLENRKICSRRGWFELVDVNHSARLGGMVGRPSCVFFHM